MILQSHLFLDHGGGRLAKHVIADWSNSNRLPAVNRTIRFIVKAVPSFGYSPDRCPSKVSHDQLSGSCTPL